MNDLLIRILSSIILIPLVLYFIFMGSIYLFFFTITCLSIALYEWNRMTRKKIHKYLGFTLLTFSFFTFYEVANNFLWSFVLLICVLTDIGGYFFGKIFKGPKLTKISPNKTYAGMIGGYFLSLIFLPYYLNWINHDISLNWFLVAILISTVSQIGDILISFFKRLSNKKNTGKIIPGHGGLLDRIDGMIFAFPVYYFIEIIEYLY